MANDENIVYIGTKNLMSYVLACVTQFSRGANKIVVKARGRAISRAVDVTEVLKSRFMADVKVQNIEISTEVIKTDEGKEINVSAIEIALSKPVVKDSSS